ncbi:hypothetical protein A3K93_01875 [Acinetobacter sp. NCu2D-2]|uniref:hypothetical protein n=1 Tax=Acinetobacter sp. NCu2D-2 TaxID=1608473 RepID=UPI0007CDC8FA|nr:hypothetical protein [Acinetobacter sp. NCu2D-2]ANF81062.1 hypothetical protein A3K93_01875 [Acinetobacter sp. NCu2D-2]
MYKQLLLSTLLAGVSLSVSAGNWLEAATSVLGAANGRVMDQAEANIERSRAQANAAIARADAAYASNYNTASQQNNSVYSTSYLKTLDCTDLAVEAKSFERTLAAAQAAQEQAAAQSNNKIAKFAGLANGALSAFAGQSDSAARLSKITGAFTGNNTQSNAPSDEVVDVALANLENIRIYQKAKKCSF